MFVSTAFAQPAAPAPASGGGAFELVSLMPLVLIFVVFYFLMIRPQQKKMKEHRAMLDAVRRGDRVVTSGGIIGTVTKIPGDNKELIVEIADNVRVRVVRSMITEVIAKGEPADDDDKDKAKDKESSAKSGS